MAEKFSSPAEATIGPGLPFSDNDVAITATTLTISGKSYQINDVVKTRIEADTAAIILYFIGLISLCVSIYMYVYRYNYYYYYLYVDFFHPKGFQVWFLATGILGYWARRKPAWLVLDLPSHRLKVLKRDPRYLKKIESRIEEARRALKEGLDRP